MVWGKINASSQHILSMNTVFKRQDVTLECGSFFFFKAKGWFLSELIVINGMEIA